VAGTSCQHGVCVWQVARSGQGAGINHKGSGDVLSLGLCQGASENRAAECNSLDLVYRRCPCEAGWQQQAASVGLCVRSFALSQPWVPLSLGQLFARWVPVNVGVTAVVSSVCTRLGLLRHVKRGPALGNGSVLLPASALSRRHAHCKGQQLSPNASVPGWSGCHVNAGVCLRFSSLGLCAFLKEMTAHEFRKQNSCKPLSMCIEGAAVKKPELMISRNVWIFFVYKHFIISLTCLP